MSRRVLILSASAGAGHLRAADAVARALAVEAPDVRVRTLDVLELASRAFRTAYSKWYLTLVDRAPALWGYLYDRLDRPARHPLGLRRVLDHWNTRRLREDVAALDPDAIVCTHFLPADVLAAEKRKRRVRARLGVVVTDADVHRLWMHHGVTRYFVARDDAAALLRSAGFDPATIEVSGIPIDPRFTLPADRAALRRKHGLPEKGAVVLVLGGGFGVGPIQEMARQVEAARTPACVVVVAGRNEALKRSLERAAGPRTRVVGFTTEMHEWMAASDLLVTKPGGLTTSEALARGLPMVLVNPIPGQEQHNADALLECGAAVRAHAHGILGFKIDALLSDARRLEQMRAAALRAARPDAARRIAAWGCAEPD